MYDHQESNSRAIYEISEVGDSWRGCGCGHVSKSFLRIAQSHSHITTFGCINIRFVAQPATLWPVDMLAESQLIFIGFDFWFLQVTHALLEREQICCLAWPGYETMFGILLWMKILL